MDEELKGLVREAFHKVRLDYEDAEGPVGEQGNETRSGVGQVQEYVEVRSIDSLEEQIIVSKFLLRSGQLAYFVVASKR